MQETSRRTVLKGAAWAAPAIAATAASPLMAATDVCEDDTTQRRVNGVAPGNSGATLKVTVPDQQKKMLIWIVGGNGGGSSNMGRGRYIHAMVDVTPGEDFILQAGGGGEAYGSGTGRGGTSAFAQGGRGGKDGSWYGAGGGGASAIVTPNGKPLIVAAGGGGDNIHHAAYKSLGGVPKKYWGTSGDGVPQNPNIPSGGGHGGQVGQAGIAGSYGWHKGDNGRYRVVTTGGAGGTQSSGGGGGVVRVINNGADIHARAAGNAASGSRGANGPNTALGSAGDNGVAGGGGGGYFGGGSGAGARFTSDPYQGHLLFGKYTTYKITGTGGGGSSWARDDVMVLEQSLANANAGKEGRCGYVAVSFMC